jgi:hypothetical protein
MRFSIRAYGAIAGVFVLAAAAAGSTASARPGHEWGDDHGSSSRHVLLISVDGLHDSDLTWWVRTHPDSNLARVVHGGTHYRNARTPIVSDSFPGLMAQITGGDPRSTGIYYDVTWNRGLLPAGSSCTPGQTTGLGTPVAYDESASFNPDSIDSGFGIPNLYPGLPSSIFGLPGDIATIDAKMVNAANLPIDPATCSPVFPHQYLRVNTIFEVAHQAGLPTAWSDKHAAYEITAGPSGSGVDDLFLPEINSSTTDPSLPAGAGPDWTKQNLDTQRYDAIKVQAVINEIDGRDHSGTMSAPVPAIFGMNFQAVSTAQKLPKSMLAATNQNGGYQLVHHRWVPGPVLTDALGFVDAQVGRVIAELQSQHLLHSTTLIISAKHGQSPRETTALKRIDDGNILDALNAAWVLHGGSGDLVAFSLNDDAMYLWLNDRSDAAIAFAKSFLLAYDQPASAGAATDYAGNPIGFDASGLVRVEDGPAFFGVPASDARVPDLVGVVQHGVVYTGGKGKIAEHGGSDPQDRHVPIVVFGAGAAHGATVRRRVETTEIAPTILALLGLDPNQLQAVQEQGTTELPHLGR